MGIFDMLAKQDEADRVLEIQMGVRRRVALAVIGEKFRKLSSQCASDEEYNSIVDMIAKESGYDSRDFLFQMGYQAFKENQPWNQAV